ncbi:hypothetical protein F5Y00DRAFT_225396 [Daldinia vernicosa]|uniref:uncharacterized protein n=1 Tax=Daldinia vernicosa TaxID=114800 RepID=UPI002007A4CD|nr:uncharacterized protein F5Y00DRAFT_225396 [Daldinia vernicosa]KAI0853088.1 hypothetical protein F5Y00DRAFT_225396 [Daldinia vernicosa]
MKFSALVTTTQILLLSAQRVLANASANVLQAASDDDDDNAYIASVCSPAKAPDQSDPAPCVEIQIIETACLPNGTSPLALEAHAQCLCGGSYFAEWLGCRRCLLEHGALSQRNFSYFSEVLSSASEKLCEGTPTAAFATLFTEAQAGVPEPTTGGTAFSDAKSGDAAVSLYYTASGLQGPGPITGSATAATVETPDSSSSEATATDGVSQNGGATSPTNTPSATSSSSSNIAVQTGAPVNGKGAIFAAAVGGALVAVL